MIARLRTWWKAWRRARAAERRVRELFPGLRAIALSQGCTLRRDRELGGCVLRVDVVECHVEDFFADAVIAQMSEEEAFRCVAGAASRAGFRARREAHRQEFEGRGRARLHAVASGQEREG